MSQGFGSRISKWHTNRKLTELENGYVKIMSQQKESYSKQLSKLQELLENGSIDKLTFERMKTALDDNYIRKRGEANASTRL